jgi:hypothetical protein
VTRTGRKAANVRGQQRRAEQARMARIRTRSRFAVAGIMTVVVAIVAMIAIKTLVHHNAPNTVTAADDAPAVVAVPSVPAAVFDAVGRGAAKAVPTRISTSEPLARDGKPVVLYVGAEYCPFCAAQRWALVVALNRFGSFADLKAARSALDDVFPGTATVSFFGARYDSAYLTFDGVELATGQRRGNAYAPLQALSAEQERIVRTFNAPPYVPAASAGAVPFADFANQFVMAGSGFSPTVLSGLSQAQIMDQLSQPGSPVTQAVVGSANAISSAICELTDGQPATVCQSPGVAGFTKASHA